MAGRSPTAGDAADPRWAGGAAALKLALSLLLLIPLSSAANLEHIAPIIPIALALLVGLSAWRPDTGLVAIAALIPVAGWMEQAADLPSFRMAEALVLAVLAGALVNLALESRRRVADAAALPAGVWPAAFLLAAAAAASVALEWRLSNIGVPATLSAVADSTASLSTSYLSENAWPPSPLLDAARLTEGVGLFLVILGCSRRRPELPGRLAVASLAGATAVASVNLSAVFARVWASSVPIEELAWYWGGVGRPSGHVTDVNAAGSYFLMMTLTGAGLAAGCRRGLVYVWALPTLAAGASFWLAGSRAAVAAALILGLGAAARRIGTRWPTIRYRPMLAGVALAVVVLPIAMVAAYPGRGGVDKAIESGRIRVEFVATSLRMWSTDPVFGVGAGRYYALSDQFMGPYIQPLWRENAHNNFLQIGAELGALGFAGTVWMLIAGGRRVRQALRAREGRPAPLLAGAGAGLAAYLLTCLAGHPLLTPETAYPFWIVSGLAVALAHRELAPPPAPGRRYVATGAAIVLFLIATLPFRVDAAVRGLASDQDARFGAFHWEVDAADGRRFRWIGPGALFFVPGDDDRTLRLPLRALHADRGRPVNVDVAVDGHPVARLPLLNDDWVELPLRLPGSGGWNGVHRINLAVDPPWPPGERQNGDGRTLGVQVGAIELTTPR